LDIALNQSLHRIGKHENGSCDKCGHPETVKHILLECVAYSRERRELIQSLKDRGVRNYTRNRVYNTRKSIQIFK